LRKSDVGVGGLRPGACWLYRTMCAFPTNNRSSTDSNTLADFSVLKRYLQSCFAEQKFAEKVKFDWEASPRLSRAVEGQLIFWILIQSFCWPPLEGKLRFSKIHLQCLRGRRSKAGRTRFGAPKRKNRHAVPTLLQTALVLAENYPIDARLTFSGIATA
jgi:hypothetical protein